MQSTTLLRSYQKSVVWSRLMLAAFFVVFVTIMGWTIPWLPYGFSEEDYNGPLVFMMFMILLACATAFVTVFLRDRTRRMGQILSTWTSVYDGVADLRRREYFFDRIMMECERARESHEVFTVVVIKMTGESNQPPQADQIERALVALQPRVREYDCLSLISPYEIGVLAAGVGGQDAWIFTERLRGMIADTFSIGGMKVRAGWAVYGRGVAEAGELLGQARAMLLSSSPANDERSA